MNTTLPQWIFDQGSLWILAISEAPIESLDAIKEDFQNNMLPIREDMRTKLADMEKHQEKQLQKVAWLNSKLDSLNWEEATIEETETITEAHTDIHIGVREAESLMAEIRGAVVVFEELMRAAEVVMARRFAQS